MHKKMTTLGTLILAAIFCLCQPIHVLAAETTTSNLVETNDTTGYEIYVDDWANLLSSSEEAQLIEILQPITEYGNAAFVSIDTNPYYNTERYVEEYYEHHFGTSSGAVFIIDMYEREIYLRCNGSISKIVTDAYALTITDNTYTYASDEQYFECAAYSFEQVHTLLEGQTISQPMKYISNALLAIVIALLLNYIIVMFVSRSKKAADAQLLNGIYTKVEIRNPVIDFLHQTKRYSPQSSGGGGSHGGGGGGSRGGGGSGGGHSF